jgi:hypothetical protein
LAKTDSSAMALATAPSPSGSVGFQCTTISYHYRNTMSTIKICRKGELSACDTHSLAPICSRATP